MVLKRTVMAPRCSRHAPTTGLQRHGPQPGRSTAGGPPPEPRQPSRDFWCNLACRHHKPPNKRAWGYSEAGRFSGGSTGRAAVYGGLEPQFMAATPL